MSLQARLNKIVIELEELSDDCRYNGEKSDLNQLIVYAKQMYLNSDCE
jgi:hypothetical protein